MEHQAQRARLVWWHSLMYATSILLAVCGVPASILVAFGFMFGPEHLSGSQALLFGSCMVGAEIVIAAVLYFVADRITKRKQKT